MARISMTKLLTLTSSSLQQQRHDLFSSCVTVKILPVLLSQTIHRRYSNLKHLTLSKNNGRPAQLMENKPIFFQNYFRLFSNSISTSNETSLLSLRPSPVFDKKTNLIGGQLKVRTDRVLCNHHKQFISLYSTKNTQVSSSVLKNQSALLVKRFTRKKIPKIHDEGKTRQLNNVVAYALGEEIKLELLQKILMKQGLYSIGELPSDVTDTLHVRGKYNVEQRPKEIFLFDDGSVVFWCVPEVERGAFLKIMMKYCDAPYPMSLVFAEREELDFTYVKGETAVMDDIIQLKEKGIEEDSNENILELYTVSNALAQSVKLSVWEASMEKFVTSIETVTEDVRHGRKISMSRRQVLKKSGELMSLRHLINLSSDLLDTPDFYWDRSSLEKLYHSMCGQLNITKRTKVINEKLTHCCELVDLVSHHLSDEHHIRLEVMIIILIMVEVVFEVVHFVRNYLDSRSTKPVTEDEEINTASPTNK